MYVRGFFENERCCVYGMCLQRVDIWGRDLGNESRGFQRLRATERRMLRMICGVTLKDKAECRVIALRVRVVRTYCKMR